MKVDGLRVKLTEGLELRLYYSANEGDKPNKRQLVKLCRGVLQNTLQGLDTGKIEPGGQGAGRVAGFVDLLVEEDSR